jgi:phenylalanyl-tRNA synthetase beta chain
MMMNRVTDQGETIDISKEQVVKIEVAANRYDLLCVEGIAAAFKTYIGLGSSPVVTIKNSVPQDQLFQVYVKPETQQVRACVVACILRDIEFDISSYNSFIDL